jgi:hypothetical protein
MADTLGAIPTTYRDVRFRSRLEAKWAAFYDLSGWPWVYEPFDLPGWSPDFRVEVLHRTPTPLACLVDVKPWAEMRREEGERFVRAGAARAKEPVVVCGIDCDRVWVWFEGTWEKVAWGHPEHWAEASNLVQWKARRSASDYRHRQRKGE